MDAWFKSRGNFRIGENSVINEWCRLDNRGMITIGANVSISADVTLLTADHDLQDPEFKGRERGVTIADYVFIGTCAMVMPGVTIGRGAAVAAGAVVTRDVGPYDIVAGIPARKIGQRTAELTYRLCYKPLFS